MSLRNWLRNNLAAGVLVLVPVLGTVALFWWLFGKVTGPGYGLLDKQLENTTYVEFLQKNRLLFRLAVLFLMLGVTVLVGTVARNLLGRRIIRLGEALLQRIPFVKRVYKALKQIAEAFWGENKGIFSGVVAVEYPREGLYTIGFLMASSAGDVGIKPDEKLTMVFLPSTPNVSIGWFAMVPKEKAIRLNMTVEDAMKMIVSGGVVLPEQDRWVEVLEAKSRGEPRGETKTGLQLASSAPRAKTAGS